MKKTFFYLLTTLLLGSTLSSCLGDTESSFESMDYGVISDISGTKTLNVLVNGYNIYYLSSPSISNYNTGDILRANYKINLNNVNSSGVISADYITVSEGSVYPNSEQEVVKNESVPESLNQYKLKSLNVPIRIVNTYLRNKMLFTYTYSKKTGESIDGLVFYYDKDNQEDAGKVENTYIIDVRLKVDGTAIGTEGTTTEGGTGADFSAFKNSVKPATIGSEGTSVSLWFRYYQENSTTPTLLKTGSIFYNKES